MADTISTAFEAVIVGWCAFLLTPATHNPKNSRRLVHWFVLLIWGLVIALSVWAVFAETEGVPSGH